jgi:hypothetical protein
MEKMPSQSTPVQRLKVAILPLDLPCSRPVTHSEDISIIGKSRKKKQDGSSKDGNGNYIFIFSIIPSQALLMSLPKFSKPANLFEILLE